MNHNNLAFQRVNPARDHNWIDRKFMNTKEWSDYYSLGYSDASKKLTRKVAGRIEKLAYDAGRQEYEFEENEYQEKQLTSLPHDDTL
jgi:hypothetical protein